MCFSFEADLAAAVVLTPLAIATLRATRTRNELLLGSLPAIFAVHQAIEAVVWLSMDGRVSDAAGQVATGAYLFIAQVLLPLLVPIGAIAMEPERWRRRLMLLPLAAGVVTAVWFAWSLVVHPSGAVAADRTLIYNSDIHIGPYITSAYIIATCGSILMSSGRYLFAFGIANVIGLSISAAIRYEAVTSVWCLYAGFSSVLLYAHFRAEHAAGRVSARTVSPARD